MDSFRVLTALLVIFCVKEIFTAENVFGSKNEEFLDLDNPVAANLTTTTRQASNLTTTTRYQVNLTTTTRYQANTTTTRLPVITTTTRNYTNVTTTSRPPIFTTPQTSTTTWSPIFPTTSSQTTTRLIPTITTTPRPVQGTIQCIYSQNSDIYGCDLQIHNPSGQEFAAIPGNHLPQRSDADVIRLSVQFQHTTNIPSIICRKFRNLRTFEVVWSELSLLTSESFVECRNMQVLDMRGNVLTAVPSGIFGNAQNLNVLGLGRNRIESLGLDAFRGTRVTEIDLEFNEIRELNASAFLTVSGSLMTLRVNGNRLSGLSLGNLINLEDLDMSLNPIRGININSMGNLRSLTADGCEISSLSADSLNGFRNLQMVSLNDNFLRSLPVGLFSSIPNIAEVSFSGNRLTKIDSRTFGATAMWRLRAVHIQKNQIESIDPDFFNSSLNLNELFVSDNFCSNRNFIIGNDNRENVRRELDVCMRNFRYVRCDYFGITNLTCSMNMRNLIGKDDFDDIEGQLPPNTNLNNVHAVIISNGTSTILPSIICHHFPNLHEISAAANGISIISSTHLQNCRNLRRLSLSSQQIANIPDNTFGNLVNLETLQLSINRIQTIGARTFAGLGPNMRELHLGSNSIERIEPGAFGSLINIRLINLAVNRLNSVNSTAFGASLRSLVEFNGSSSQINAIDPFWFNNATALNTLYMTGNPCINTSFLNVQNNRNSVANQLQSCFNNFRP